MQLLKTTDPDFRAGWQAILDEERATADPEVAERVRGIISEVREKGDQALTDLTQKFDRFDPEVTGLAVSVDEIEAATASIDPDLMSALTVAADRIKAFHERQVVTPLDYTDETGTRLGQSWSALEAVGLYVPGGLAAYPSSVLMNALPAVVAGVERMVMVVPTPDGVLNPLVLAAAKLSGVTEIYRIGGAQAVAALAYGTATITPVHKIVGPGNAYVAEAKRQVFGKVGIDTIAGPSEIFVISDANSDPRWIAADLLSQAEHDSVAQAVLATDNAAFADAVADAVQDHLETLPRSAIARESWDRYGAILVAKDLNEATELANEYASEHLELAVADPDALLANVRHAGAVFLGRYTPEAIGDYIAGPNHVLPTSHAARFSSGLSVYDFLKRTTFVGCTAESLQAIGPGAVTLANAEGLQAHALSVSIRLNDMQKP